MSNEGMTRTSPTRATAGDGHTNDADEANKRPSMPQRLIWGMVLVWPVAVVASLVWNVLQVKQNTLETARIQARVAYDKDIIYRRWNAEYGGVYVLVSEGTQPNPNLSDTAERDITTPSGKQLTLINPAYMTRQVHELAKKEFGVHGHITSLIPIRSENSADPWETEALRAFELGETEISSVEAMQGREYMRLMRPLLTEKGCLACHARQGYQEGEIRGGISVSIPMDPLRSVGRKQMFALIMGHGLLWLMGLVVIISGEHRRRRSKRR